jgi:membrane associated rhomboid family serine protease
MVVPLRDIQPRQKFPIVTVVFIIINFLLFFYELSLGRDLGRFLQQHAFIPAAYFEEGALASLQPIFLSMFLHGGWMHLLGNMLYLWIFGDNVEDRLGRVPYVLFYLFCGVGATLSHAYSNPQSVVPSIGASGAIAGVLGAYLAMFPKARVMTLVPLGFFLQLAELPALIVLGLWFVLQIFSGFASLSAQTAQSAGVAWWAHIGGFVVGLIVGMIMRTRHPPPRRPFSAFERRPRRGLFGVVLLALGGAVVPASAWSQSPIVLPEPGAVLIPDQQHDQLRVELHTIADDVLFFIGDPQAFLSLRARPGSIAPRVDFTNTGRSAVLRILDQTLFEDVNPPEPQYVDGDPWMEEERAEPIPESQDIEIKLFPASAGTYVLHVEQGSAVFDFTDLPIEHVDLLGDSTRIEVAFDRPNLVTCERFRLTMVGGEMEFRNLLNARASSITLQLPRTEARVEITGKEFDGTSEVWFEGTPRSLEVVVSKKVGVRVSGLAEPVTHFARKGMRRDELSLVSENYDQETCKVHLHFSRPVPHLDVDWD